MTMLDFTQSPLANLLGGLIFVLIIGVPFLALAATALAMGVWSVISPIFLLLDWLTGDRFSKFGSWLGHRCANLCSQLTPTIRLSRRTTRYLKTSFIIFLILLLPGYFVAGHVFALKMSHWDGDEYLKQYVGKPVHHTVRGQSLDSPFNTVEFMGYESEFHMGAVRLHDRSWAGRQTKKHEDEGSHGVLILYDEPRSIWLETGRAGGFGTVDLGREFDLPGKIHIVAATERELAYIIDK